MYFWRVEKLKKEMVARPLPEREVLPYLVVCMFLTVAVTYIPNTEPNGWDDLRVTSSALLAAIGTMYIYHRNGSAAGQHFLQRYFAIGWVVAVRWLPILILSFVALYGTLFFMGTEIDGTAWYDFVFGVVGEAIVYWRIGHHVGDLAQRTSTFGHTTKEA